MFNFLSALLVAVVLISGCSREPSEEVVETPPPLRVAVVSNGETDDFWQAFQAGAIAAASEEAVELRWQPPTAPATADGQAAVIKELLKDRLDALVLAPLDQTTLAEAVASASAEGVVSVVVDTPLDGQPGKDYACYISADYYRAGELGAQQLSLLLESGKGSVGLLRHHGRQPAAVLREKGFEEKQRRDFPGLELVADHTPAGPGVADAQTAAAEMLKLHEDLLAIYCSSPAGTVGAWLALRESGQIGEVKLVGFGSSEEIARGIRAGQIHAVLVSDPYKTAYLAVKTAVAAARGESVQAKVDAGIYLVNKKNIDQPRIKKVMFSF